MPPSANGLLAPNRATFISVHPNLMVRNKIPRGQRPRKGPLKVS